NRWKASTLGINNCKWKAQTVNVTTIPRAKRAVAWRILGMLAQRGDLDGCLEYSRDEDMEAQNTKGEKEVGYEGQKQALKQKVPTLEDKRSTWQKMEEGEVHTTPGPECLEGGVDFTM
ncbi:hypothetical protein P7K49_028964, partial [Saguinus oedipus]